MRWSCLPLALLLEISRFLGVQGAFLHPRLATHPGGVALNDTNDLSYYATIALGKQTYTVLIDTGSSDLWVAGKLSKSNDTGLNATISYAANSVKGSLKTATLEFAGHVVPDQAFLEIAPTDRNREGYGILGLGPSSGSYLSKLLPSKGEPALNRIFVQNRTTSNFFTILLGRSKDAFNGSITVGEVLPEYSSIVNEPKLAMTKVPAERSDDQHLQILLDSEGIIGPDGHPIPLTTSVEQTKNKTQATVVLDCGFSLPQMTKPVVDAIYSRYKGAEFMQVAGIGGSWILPCEQEVNVTLKFGGKAFPVHPLDMSMEMTTLGLPEMKTSDGERACLGTFQPFTYDRGSSPDYDMVLGMAFMRNVYTLVDYGDFVQGSSDHEAPYIQLLSTTEPIEAHRDFVNIRLGGTDTTSGRGLKPVTPGGNDGKKNTMYYIIAAVAGVVVFAVVAVLCLRIRRRRRRLR